ncbi:MAG: ATP-binding protein [Chitinophagaceae bacterium]|nr:ATP-binding protein [Chitinophagaceae bacterium]
MLRPTPIGITTFRNSNIPFGIKDQDRFGHIYCIGKTGTGKSTLLLNMAISDIQKGNGICVIDPHGDIAETLLEYIPASRVKDVVYFNPQDTDFPLGFNPLFGIKQHQHPLAVSGLLSTFKKIWAESWGPRLEYILRFSLLTLLEYPHSSLLDVQPLLTDSAFRSQVLRHIKNPSVLRFWHQEYASYSPALKAEAITPVLNKIGVFSTNMILQNIIGQKEKTIQIGTLMDAKQIVIVNLAKGAIGEDVTSLLGSMLVNNIQIAALSRATQPENNRAPFFVYIDEMQSFISLSFADMLSEARKFKVGLFLAHQYVQQVHEKIQDAIIGNTGTIICFRVGSSDALVLEKEFTPVFTHTDLIALPRYHMYMKLMIDGATSKPFSAKTLPLPIHHYRYKKEVKDYSRFRYAQRKEDIEALLYHHTPVPPSLQTLFD